MDIAEHLNRPGTVPPATGTRFRKGQSGNPKGRPRKVAPVDDPRPCHAEASMYEMVRGEAYRPVRVRNGRRSVEMSAICAGLREMSLKAAKGNRLALSALMQLMLQTEALEAKRAEASPVRRSEPTPEVAAAEEYKDVWSRVLVEAAGIGATLDPPGPHPDEVTIARVGGTVSWPGSVPGETLSLNGLAAMHAELAARLPETRREIDALPDGYDKVVALCSWFEQGDLCRVIRRNLPDRYHGGPAADWRAQEADRRTREWALLQRHDLEWEMARAREKDEADAGAGAGEPAETARTKDEGDPLAGPASDPRPAVANPAIQSDAAGGAPPAILDEARIYVRAWNAALSKAEELGLPPPGPLLHPEDVLIDEETGRVSYRKPPTGDRAATCEQAREGLAQLRRMVERYAKDLAWADAGELQDAVRKLDSAKQVCAAMQAVLDGEPG